MQKGLSKADLNKTKVNEKFSPSAKNQLDGLQLLLVEDSPDIQMLMRRILETNGAVVASAVNGAEAFEMAMDKNFDLVLMDMEMPILDGYETTKKLRAKGNVTPIVALTANAMHGERETCLAAGCVEYISKPVKAKTLVDIVGAFAMRR